MEFLLLLTAKDKEILDLVYKARFSVEENTPLCLLGKKFFGFLKTRQKTVVICTRNAQDLAVNPISTNDHGNENYQTAFYIRRALRHEAVHVAQMCNNGKVISSAGKNKFKLHPFKETALKGSTKISGNEKKEYEAYWMEDKPNLVISALKKYCL